MALGLSKQLPSGAFVLMLMACLSYGAAQRGSSPDVAEDENLANYLKLFLILVATGLFFELRFSFVRWTNYATAALALLLLPGLRDPIIAHVTDLWDFLRLQEALFASLDVYLSFSILLFFTKKILPAFLYWLVYFCVPIMILGAFFLDDPTALSSDWFSPQTPQFLMALGVATTILIRHGFFTEMDLEMHFFSILLAILLSFAVTFGMCYAAHYITSSADWENNPMESLDSFSACAVHVRIILILCGLAFAKIARQPMQPWRLEMIACSIPVAIVAGLIGLVTVQPRIPPMTGLLQHVGSIWIEVYGNARSPRHIAAIAVIAVGTFFLQYIIPKAFVAHYRFHTVDELEEAIRQYYAIADPSKDSANPLCKDRTYCLRLAEKGFHLQEQLQDELYVQSQNYARREREKLRKNPAAGFGAPGFPLGTAVNWFSEEEMEQYRQRQEA